LVANSGITRVYVKSPPAPHRNPDRTYDFLRGLDIICDVREVF